MCGRVVVFESCYGSRIGEYGRLWGREIKVIGGVEVDDFELN